MALERFIAQHRLIAETLVGVNAERMTSLEIHFNEITNNYDLAYAIAVAESAEAVDGFEGKYDEITAILKAIGEKRGLDWNELLKPRTVVSRDLEVFYPENRYLNFYITSIDDDGTRNQRRRTGDDTCGAWSIILGLRKRR